MRWFIFSVLTMIFILSPYSQGLYFHHNFYGIQIVLNGLFIILALRLVLRQEMTSVRPSMIVFLLPVCYLLSLPVAESPQGALDLLLRWVSYASFFVLLYWTSLQSNIKKWLPVVFQLTGIWISFHMLFVNYGWLDYRSILNEGRFAGVFQYANTFGLAMVVFFLFSLILLTATKLSRMFLVLYSVALVPYMVCFIQSYSRGMILIFPLVWFAGLVLLPFRRQVEYFLYTLVSSACALLVTRIMEQGKAISAYAGLGTLIITIVLTIGFIFASKKILTQQHIAASMDKAENKKWATFAMPLSLLVISIAGLLDLLYKGLLYQKLPALLQERIASTTLQASTAKARIMFVEDAMQMSKDSPLIGFGGEGWATLYKKYQQIPYVSNKIHNGYLEWIIDTGWIGFIIFIGVFSYLYILILRHYVKDRENPIYVAVIVSLAAIFLHSFIDFNFSYGTIWFLTFWLLVIGIAAPLTVQENERKNQSISVQMGRWSIAMLSGFSILVLCSLVFSYRFATAHNFYEQSKQTKSISMREKLLQQAISYNPYELTYQLKLSNVYELRIKRGAVKQYRAPLSSQIQYMVSLEPQNSMVLSQAGKMSEVIGERGKALQFYQLGLEVDHYDARLYENRIRLQTQLANHMRKNGEYSKMKSLAESSIKDYELNKTWYKTLLKNLAKEDAALHNNREFTTTGLSHYYAALSYFILGKYNDVSHVLNQLPGDADITVKTKLLALNIVALEKVGKLEEAQILLQNNNDISASLLENINIYRTKY